MKQIKKIALRELNTMMPRDARKTPERRANRKWMLLMLVLFIFLPALALSESTVEDYTKIIEANPNDAGAYYDRGCAYSVQKEYDEAIADFARAIELNSNDATYYNERGNAYYFQKKYDEAAVDYSRAMELDPTNVTFVNNRGWVYYDQKEYAEAIADYSSAI
ncbi:MAG: tetratricopeptide repeat protein, partial [Clostridia bacterium]|nr:tetratricopeptide repeat protein [Clostridia bacterium]